MPVVVILIFDAQFTKFKRHAQPSKSKAEQQKLKQNSSFQCENALKSFTVVKSAPMPKNVLLVDDVVDSRWTITVCGFKLMEAGCLKVFPFALADSNQKEE